MLWRYTNTNFHFSSDKLLTYEEVAYLLIDHMILIQREHHFRNERERSFRFNLTLRPSFPETVFNIPESPFTLTGINPQRIDLKTFDTLSPSLPGRAMSAKRIAMRKIRGAAATAAGS